jgi:hypothetical protein
LAKDFRGIQELRALQVNRQEKDLQEITIQARADSHISQHQVYQMIDGYARFAWTFMKMQ